MNARRFVLFTTLTLALAAIVLMPGLASLAQAQGPDEAAAACTADFKQKWMPKGNCKTNAANHFLGTLDNQPLVIKTNAAERMRIAANGNVGIGTNSPGSKLTVAGIVQSTSGGFKFPDGSTQTTAVSSSNFVKKNGDTMTGALQVTTPAGTIPLRVRQNTPENTTPALALFETSEGALGSLGANQSTFVISAAGGKQMALKVNGATSAMNIDTDGSIGIGTTPPGNAKLTVQASQDGGFRVLRLNGLTGFYVSNTGQVFANDLTTFTSTTHICQQNGYLGVCSSAAEYVPTIDGGNGFPETADLVSIAPNVKNPYGDTHGPFTVQKSTTPCEPNLLGFIVKPESGADGKKLNNRHLPLAIYGYFPAKVTMENGLIRRGDALTSSSKPGYAMKATDACKTIGYALEDARAEGTIQVFADLGENAASEVAELRQEMRIKDAQLEELKEQVETLQRQNAALEQRFLQLELLVKSGDRAASTAAAIPR